LKLYHNIHITHILLAHSSQMQCFVLYCLKVRQYWTCLIHYCGICGCLWKVHTMNAISRKPLSILLV